jgi:hypothetical protein
MEDLFSRLASQDVVGVVFIVLAFVTGMTIWLTLQWRLHRRTEIEAALKQDMLNRGMSAGEIERVLRASLSGGGDSSPDQNLHLTAPHIKTPD